MLVTRDSNPVLFLFYTERTPGDAWRARKCVSAHAPGILDSREWLLAAHACAEPLPAAGTL